MTNSDPVIASAEVDLLLTRLSYGHVNHPLLSFDVLEAKAQMVAEDYRECERLAPEDLEQMFRDSDPLSLPDRLAALSPAGRKDLLNEVIRRGGGSRRTNRSGGSIVD